MRYNIRRSTAVGNDVPGINPGFLIAGVVIDNPSGSWLTVQLPYGPTFVPPYTLGFATSVAPAAQVIDVLYTVGPNTLESTTAGDPFVIYVFDDVVANNAGTPFVVPAPATITPVATTIFARVGASVNADRVVEYESTISASERMRLFSIAISYNLTAIVPSTHLLDSDIMVVARQRLGIAAPAGFIGTVTLSPESPQGVMEYGVAGFDMDIGYHLWLQATSLYGVVPIVVTPTYQIV